MHIGTVFALCICISVSHKPQTLILPDRLVLNQVIDAVIWDFCQCVYCY